MTTGNSVADYRIEKCSECKNCKGRGLVLDTSEKSYGKYITCPECNGKGYVEEWI